MSPSGLVSIRWVKPLPAPVVIVETMLAPTSRSVAFLVVTVPLLLAALLPSAPTATSSALTGSIPLYSIIRMSGQMAALLKVTVTALAPPASPRCS